MDKKNLLVIGRPCDLYRTQTFVNTVMRKYDKWNLSISYLTITCWDKYNLLKKIIRKLISCIDLLLSFYKILRADYIYIPAMNLYYTGGIYYQFIVAKLFKKKMIAEFYISLYDTYVLDRKIVSPNSSTVNRLIDVDRKLHSCYKTIYLNRTEAERYSVLVNHHLSLKDTVIIPLSIEQRSMCELPYYRNKAQVFNICWWGTYIPLHGLDKIIQAVSEVIKKHHNVHFYIFGNNEAIGKDYQEIISQLGLQDYITIRNDYTFRNGLLEDFLVKNCDLAMGAFGDSEKARTVILNKCIEAVAMKLPVLTQKSVAFQEYFPKDNSAIFYAENSMEGIVKGINQIIEMSPSSIEEHISNGFEIYKQNFSIESSIKKYEELLDNL